VVGGEGVGKTHLLVGVAREVVNHLAEDDALLWLTLPWIDATDLEMVLHDGISHVFVDDFHLCPPDLLNTLIGVLGDAKLRNLHLFVSSRRPLEEIDPELRSTGLAHGTNLVLAPPEHELKVELASQLLEGLGSFSTTQAEQIARQSQNLAEVVAKINSGNLPEPTEEDAPEEELLPPGEGFYMVTRNPMGGVEILHEFNHPGALVVSRLFPNKINSLFDFEVQNIWLSNVQSEQSIRPVEIDRLEDAVLEYMATHERGLVFMEGVSTLMLNHGPGRVLELLDTIVSAAAHTNTILVFSFNPASVTEDDLLIVTSNISEIEVEGLE